MKYRAIVDGQQIEISFEGEGVGKIDARIGDRHYALEAYPVEPGIFWFSWNNKSIEIAVTPGREGYTVSIGDRQLAVEIMDARAALRKAAQHGHEGAVELRAPMPGKVVKILVEEGGTVAPNQGILVMEAMKMQNEIKSPKGGVVRKFLVGEGIAVNSGDILAIVE